MGAILNLVERNLHEVHVDADRMLFHIPSYTPEGMANALRKSK